jgi:hypothetical protein
MEDRKMQNAFAGLNEFAAAVLAVCAVITVVVLVTYVFMARAHWRSVEQAIRDAGRPANPPKLPEPGEYTRDIVAEVRALSQQVGLAAEASRAAQARPERAPDGTPPPAWDWLAVDAALLAFAVMWSDHKVLGESSVAAPAAQRLRLICDALYARLLTSEGADSGDVELRRNLLRMAVSADMPADEFVALGDAIVAAIQQMQIKTPAGAAAPASQADIVQRVRSFVARHSAPTE